ncbi:MAG: bifunctional DNA-formamidopyrimidine glycosylase/DNA-(apurinic or apyrimidinic site) lyase [Candidatus Paceibacterota bacterium]|jgi:formamidopyrimidine-DNA glycosylase
MPELPEVETTVFGLNKCLTGKKIMTVWSDWKKGFKNSGGFDHFVKNVLDKKVHRVRRVGKNILIDLSGGKTILVHMKMTGHFMCGKWTMSQNKKDKYPWTPVKNSGPLCDPYNRFIHTMFDLSNKTQLAFSDARKFAKMTIFDTKRGAESPDIKNLGPDLLDKKFNAKDFVARIKSRPTGKIKQVMTDQTIVAGVGNIYADESLWLSAIHPKSVAGKIPEKKLRDLYKNLLKIMRQSIKLGGDSASDFRNLQGEKGKFQNYHMAYRKTGEKCKKIGCKGKIIMVRIGGRSSHFCPHHQTLS